MPVVGLYLQQPLLSYTNKQHYSSDVLAGADYCRNFMTNYNPFQAIKFGKKNLAFIYPQFGQTNGLGILIKPDF
jgi:hypothetical protein